MAKGQKPAPIASKIEIAKRVDQCLDWLRKGYTRQRAVQEGSTQWGITIRQVDDYWAAALAELSKVYEKNRLKMLAEIDSRLDYIYNEAITEQVISCKSNGEPVYGVELGIARQAAMDKAKLAGLLKDQVEIMGNLKTGLEDLSNEELNAAWDEENN